MCFSIRLPATFWAPGPIFCAWEWLICPITMRMISYSVDDWCRLWRMNVGHPDATRNTIDHAMHWRGFFVWSRDNITFNRPARKVHNSCVWRWFIQNTLKTSEVSSSGTSAWSASSRWCFWDAYMETRMPMKTCELQLRTFEEESWDSCSARLFSQSPFRCSLFPYHCYFLPFWMLG